MGNTEEVFEANIGPFGLKGDLFLPSPQTREIVLFAHGSGSSRRSSRNRYVASILNGAGFGTLLMDLLTPEEEQEEYFSGHLRFNIELLANRLEGATGWLEQYYAASRSDPHLKIGYFGASTGAAAALAAAAKMPEKISAVVSRGGRPDLAQNALSRVRAPTLLIVGGRDEPVIPLNEGALRDLACKEKKLVVVPGASHLFEEAGTLEAAALSAKEWFDVYLKDKKTGGGIRAA